MLHLQTLNEMPSPILHETSSGRFLSKCGNKATTRSKIATGRATGNWAGQEKSNWKLGQGKRRATGNWGRAREEQLETGAGQEKSNWKLGQGKRRATGNWGRAREEQLETGAGQEKSNWKLGQGKRRATGNWGRAREEQLETGAGQEKSNWKLGRARDAFLSIASILRLGEPQLRQCLR